MTRNNMLARVAAAAVVVAVLSAGGAFATEKCTGATGYTTAEYCPYGYAAIATGTAPATASVKDCCERDETTPSFPVCSAATSGGTDAVQALSGDETSWGVQDGNGFTRSIGRFTGMCFNVLIDNNDCDATANPECCTTKKPAYLQVKLPTATAAGIDTKCKLSYGSAVVTVNGIKRITKWSADIGASNKIKLFNLPLTFKKGAKTASICLYSTYAFGAAFDCSFESMCGFGTTRTTTPVVASVPDDNGNYAGGCEFRIVGRKGAASSACCSPTFSVESFDSTTENRLAGGASGTTIELNGA